MKKNAEKKTLFFDLSSLICCLTCLSLLYSVSPSAAWATIADNQPEHELFLLTEENKRHHFLKDAYKQDPKDYDSLWHFAYSLIRQGWLSRDSAQRKQDYLSALELAKKAYDKCSDSYESHFLLGAAKAKAIGYFSRPEQVRLVRELGRHANYLLEKRTDDPDVWYIYAWWHFRLSEVSATERMLSLFLGGLPSDCSYDDAFYAMDRAIHLRPDYAVYLYDMGTFHDRIGNTSTAQHYYAKALQVSPTTPEDYIYMRRAQRKLANSSLQP